MHEGCYKNVDPWMLQECRSSGALIQRIQSMLQEYRSSGAQMQNTSAFTGISLRGSNTEITINATRVPLLW